PLFRSEQLEALHDVLVAVAPRLAREDHLVDAVALVAPQVVADLGGRAHRAAEPARVVENDLGPETVGVRGGRDRCRLVPGGGPALLVLGPQVVPRSEVHKSELQFSYLLEI